MGYDGVSRESLGGGKPCTACLGEAQLVETQICKKRKTAPGVAQRLEGAGSERGDERRNSAHA